MSVDYTVKKPNDLGKINPNDFGELLWWSYQLGMTPEKIVTWTQKNGNEVKKLLQSAKE